MNQNTHASKTQKDHPKKLETDADGGAAPDEEAPLPDEDEDAPVTGNEFDDLVENLGVATKKKFQSQYGYVFNGVNTKPPTWDKQRGGLQTRTDFVNVNVLKSSKVHDYINATIAKQAPEFCQADVANDLVELTTTTMDLLPSTGFMPTQFTRTYNQMERQLGVRFDSIMLACKTVIKEDGVDNEYMFMYFIGVFYFTAPWFSDDE